MNIRLYNAKILTMERNKPIFQGEIWIKNDKIAYVARQEELDEGVDLKSFPRINWDYEMDCEGNLLMPGFKDAHAHAVALPRRNSSAGERQLSEKDFYDWTRLAILEYLTSGITTIFHMSEHLDAVCEACLDTGMRSVFASSLSDYSSSPGQVEEEYLRLNKKSPLITYQLGFGGAGVCSKELLYRVSELAHRHHLPVFAHMEGTAEEVEMCKKNYGMTPTVFLDSLGIFEFGGGIFHPIHMSGQDLEVLRKRRMYAITSPAYHMKTANGIAPMRDFEKCKIPVALGTDAVLGNYCPDMFREMFLVSGMTNIRERKASSMDAMRVLRMATVHGARGMRLNKADVLAKGKYADMILIDLHTPNMQGAFSIQEQIVNNCSKMNVKMTMIGGKILYRNGEFNVGISPKKLYEKCKELSNRMLSE